MLKSNQDLIHTIKTILQVFPEGVIIRSLDEKSKQTILKFANNIASKVLVEEECKDDNKNSIKIKEVELQNNHLESESTQTISLEEFLSQQENKIEIENAENIEQIIKTKQSIDILHEELESEIDNDEKDEEVYFNVKSIKVSWDGNNESFMHVFTNTTQVKKLEEERANRHHQQFMFASLSHELRTPLNAFTNSLTLIDLTFEEIKLKINKCQGLIEKVDPLYPKISKFIKIGRVSSCLLMNLVDDILDMSKFNAQTFQLNIDQFNLNDLLDEIDYIFGFQCTEKHLDFSIKCLTKSKNKMYWSDQK